MSEQALLEILIPGKTASGNHATRTGAGGHYKPKKSLAFQDSVYNRVFIAAHESKWAMPEFVRVDVTLYNCRQDRDNAVKVLMDAMQGVAYASDSKVLDGGIRRVKDAEGPRTAVTVSTIDATLYGYPAPKKRGPQPMPHCEWVSTMTADATDRRRSV